MKTILLLLKKDLLRDLRRPWGFIVFLCIPIVMATLMALAFGGQAEDQQTSITIHVAVMDQDDDFIADMLRSVSSQGEAGENLQLHYVENEEDGLRLLEKRKASAFVILPKNLTSNLLDGVTSTIKIYKNPAETMLPKMVELGVGLGTIFVSEGLEFIGPEIKTFREWIKEEDRFSNWSIAMTFFDSLEKIDRVRTYITPPLIQYKRVAAKDYIPSVSVPISNAAGEGS